MNSIIPIIDLKDLYDEEGFQIIAKKIKQAYTTYGFSILVNHGVPEEVINNTFSISHQFHNLEETEKLKIKQNDCFRGYMPIKKSRMKLSTLGETDNPNQSEAFIMAFEPNKESSDYQQGKYLNGDNQYPKSLPELKPVMIEYRDHLLKLASMMMRVFSVAMGESKDYLNAYFNPPTYFLRLQKYPHGKNQENTYGIAPHTDYGFFTFVVQEDTPGLEVLYQNEWVGIPVIKNAFVLNSGDMCRRMSNDLFKSTPHRVINESPIDRYSIPFFFEPNMRAKVSVMPNLRTNKSNQDYPEILYGDYLMQRIQANYNLGTGAASI